MAKTHHLTGNDAILKGKTWRLILRSLTEPIVRKPITGIDLSTGCPRLTVVGHGCVDGWPTIAYGIKGTKQLNAEDPSDFSKCTFKTATVIDPNTIEFNAINAADFAPYVEGGFIAYFTSEDLTGKTCRVKFKDKVGGTVLLSTESGDTPNNVVTAVLDNTAKTILITVPASASATMRKSGVWEAEMADGSVEPVVNPLILVSDFEVTDEVVT